jgi:hypothetical protein
MGQPTGTEVTFYTWGRGYESRRARHRRFRHFDFGPAVTAIRWDHIALLQSSLPAPPSDRAPTSRDDDVVRTRIAALRRRHAIQIYRYGTEFRVRSEDPT